MKFRKLTALLLSVLMLSSMVALPASAEAADDAIETDDSWFEDSGVEFETEYDENGAAEALGALLPEISADAEVEGDFEYVVDTSVDEAKITKYNGNDTVVTIPAKIGGYLVTTLGDSAFEGYRKLREVKFPNKLTKLEPQVFLDCDRLETADLPDSVESIGAQAFKNCKKLKSFHFPKNWKETDNWGSGEILRGCEKITSVTVPEGVENLPEFAFGGSDYLKTVTLPSTLKTIGKAALRDCDAITSVTIPDSVTSIGEEAFRYCENLKNIKLPKSLVTIGGYAMSDCPRIREIVIPGKVTTVGYAAFYNDERLETADLPDSVENLGRYAFEKCKKLVRFHFPKKWEKIDSGSEGYILKDCENISEVTVPEGVTALPSGAFYGCNYLTTIKLPSTLTKISDSSLGGCERLQTVKIPDSVKSIEQRAFCDDPALQNITIPKNVTTIGQSAFENSGITAITISDNITVIEPYTFKNCKHLVKVTFPSKLTTVNTSAFEGCEKLESAQLPDSVETIGYRAFMACKSLTNFHYPAKLEKTESEIFRDCEGLTEMSVPEGVKSLPDYLFDGANCMKKLTLPAALTKIGTRSISYCTSLKSITIPEKVTSIGENAFKGTAITEITLPKSLEKIQNNAFEECTKLEVVNFPNGLVSIGYAAFYKCEKLQKAYLPDSVESIGRYAFGKCTSLTSFRYPAKWERLDSEGEGNIFRDCESLTSITVPEGIKFLPNYAFDGSNCLEKLTLPNSLTKIGTRSISNCTKLREIKIPGSVKTIGSYAFEGCEEIRDVTLTDSLENVEEGAFNKCRRLEVVNFPNNLRSIGKYAFNECEKLRAAELPDSVETIGYQAFRNCRTLSSFHYPTKLENTESSIFENCESLNTIVVPEGVKAIPKEAFSHANCLVTITLPATLTTIGENAFSYCDNLRDVTIPKSIQTIGRDAFVSCPSLTIYCPKYIKAVIDFINDRINVVSNDDARRDIPKALEDSASSYQLYSGSKINVVCSYAVKNSAFNNAENLAVRMFIPDDSMISKDSLYVNGKLATDFNEDGNYLTVPITKRTGKISFTLDAEADCHLRTYAILTYRLNGKDDFDIIDIINEDFELITLNSADLISKRNMEVTGMAPAEKEVNIYVDGNIVSSVIANKGGVYNAALDLGAMEEGERFRLRAETTDKKGETIFAQKSVKYSEHAPELSGFSMDYNGLSYDLMSGKKHKVVFVLEAPHKPTPFKFTVNYKNPDNIERVYITSTRNQITKKILAVYDKNSGNYVANGYFDNNDHDYVPGKIGVQYLEKHSYETISPKDIDNIYSSDMLPDILKNASYELTTDEKNFKQVVITVEGGDQIVYTYERLEAKEFKSEYQASHSVTSSASDIAQCIADYSWTSRSDGGITTYAEFDKRAGENQTIAWSYQAGNNYVERETVDFGKTDAKKSALMYVAEDDVTLMAKFGWNYAVTDDTEYILCSGYEIDYNKAKAEILSSSLSSTRKNAELNKLNELRRMAIEMTSMKMIGAFMNKVGALSFGTHPSFTLVIYTIIINFTGTGIDVEIPGGEGPVDYNDSDDTPAPSDTEDAPQPAPISTDDQADNPEETGESDVVKDHANTNASYYQDALSFTIDPSGFVYEGVESNRVSGATVTAYWIPYDGSDDYWDNYDVSKAVVWNASEYSQTNPLTTDAGGNYAWDVPEGMWKVVVEKDGYTKTESEWLPVPPPQTEVNINLASERAPNVTGAKADGRVVTVDFDQYIDPKTVTSIKFANAYGKEFEYSVDYSKNEMDAEGNAFAKTFMLNVTSASGKITMTVPSDVKSYCGVSAEEYTAEFEFAELPEDSDNKNDSDGKSSDNKDSENGGKTDSDDNKDSDDKKDNSDSDNKGSDEDTKNGNLGDLDGDNAITSADALLILRMSVGLDEVTDAKRKLGDIDGDNDITSGDALALLRYSVGLSEDERINKPV